MSADVIFWAHNVASTGLYSKLYAWWLLYRCSSYPKVPIPLKQNKVDSSDHVTFFHCSRVQCLCSLANWSFSSFFFSFFDKPHDKWFTKGSQLLSPNTWVLFALCVWKCSYFHYQTLPWVLLLIFLHVSHLWLQSFKIAGTCWPIQSLLSK